MSQMAAGAVRGLNEIGSPFCDYAAQVSVQSALLILVLWAIDVLLHRRVRAVYRYCLWMLVLIKLILPPTLSLPTGIGYWWGDQVVAAIPLSNPIADTGKPGPTNQLASQELLTSTGELRIRPVQDSVKDDHTEPSTHLATPSLTWQAMFFMLWCVGLFAFLVLFAQRVRFVRGLVIVARPGREELSALLQQCQEQLGLYGMVKLKLSDTIPSPAVCGLLRPTILVPSSLPGKLSIDGQRAVLLHELAHIKRGDLWVNALQAGLQMIYFYNPLVWFANCRIRRICEQAVDETVLVALRGQAQNYSKVLINISEMALWKTNLGLRLVGVAESKKALLGRIRHMLARPLPKTTKLGLCGVLSILALGAVLLPMAHGNTNPSDDNASKSPLMSAAQSPQSNTSGRSAISPLSDAQKQLIATIAAANRTNSRKLSSFEYHYERTSKTNMLRTTSGHYAFSKNRMYEKVTISGNEQSLITVKAGGEVWAAHPRSSSKIIVHETEKYVPEMMGLAKAPPWNKMEPDTALNLDQLNSESVRITSVREATIDNVRLVVVEMVRRWASEPPEKFSHEQIYHFSVAEGYLPVRVEHNSIDESGESIPIRAKARII